MRFHFMKLVLSCELEAPRRGSPCGSGPRVFAAIGEDKLERERCAPPLRTAQIPEPSCSGGSGSRAASPGVLKGGDQAGKGIQCATSHSS